MKLSEFIVIIDGNFLKAGKNLAYKLRLVLVQLRIGWKNKSLCLVL